jgi:hypothetical protein
VAAMMMSPFVASAHAQDLGEKTRSHLDIRSKIIPRWTKKA